MNRRLDRGKRSIIRRGEKLENKRSIYKDPRNTCYYIIYAYCILISVNICNKVSYNQSYQYCNSCEDQRIQR